MPLSRLALAVALLAWPGAGLAAQDTTTAASGEALRVFLDCHAFCDRDYFRREITYVNWMRDRQDAEVHLLITDQNTGGGGQEITLKFIGLRGFTGVDDEFKFTTQQSDTFEEIRGQLTQRIGLGLTRYVVRGSLAGQVKVSFTPPEGGLAQAQEPRDPWNYWVFTLGANANFSGESQSSNNNLGGNLRAQRITEQWKFETRLNVNRRHSRFNLDSGEVFRSRTSRYTYTMKLAKSLGDHWSAGINLAAGRSSVSNYDLLLRAAPGLEYDIFPYRESSRRELYVVYEVGLMAANYREETVFSKLEETRVNHSLTVAAEAVAPWGNVEVSVSGSTYLDHWSQNRLSAFGGLEVRLTRGLELELFGGYSRVRDQLSLAKEGATDEEVLLRLKQLQTDYRYEMFIGLRYTFGSKFNNIVNPRFNAGVDAFDFFFF
ncbi:MAG: hypothetical protein ACRENB_15835 [Gemmatimonadales bacterium]